MMKLMLSYREDMRFNGFVLLAFAMACSSSPKLSAPKAPTSVVWDARANRSLTVTGLKANDLVKKEGVDCQFKLVGSTEGSRIFWALNDLPPEPLSDSEGRLKIKDGLKSGANVLRVFVVGPNNQMAQGTGAAQQIGFSYESTAAQSPSVYIVSPRGSFSKEAGENLPFQLLLHNEGVKPSKVFVRYALNSEERELTGIGPFELKNLAPGHYKIEAWLVNSAGRKIDGYGQAAQATFSIQK
jgi:hypothetical protein